METHTRSISSFNSPVNCHIETPLSGLSDSNNSNGALLFQQGYMRKKSIEEILKEEELNKMDEEYWNKQMDSLQVQINALRTKNEQLNTRLTSHLNDNMGHEQKVGLEGSDLDV